MKNIILLFFFSLFGIYFGQTINLHWKGARTIESGYYGTKQIPNLEGFNTDYYNGNLILNLKKELPNAKVTKLTWELIKPSALYDISPGQLATRDIAEASNVINSEKNIEETQFLINLFKREHHKIYRLKSFRISAQQTALKPKTKNLAPRAITTTNPLSEGTFYKIRVDKSGIFKITYQFLKQNGINPSDINPENFRIYGNGGLMLPEYNEDPRFTQLQENAIEIVGGKDGRWDEQDYALFYAQGPDGFNLYKTGLGYTTNKKSETRTDPSLNFKNLYENYAYYFINFDKGPGQRIQKRDLAPPASGLITTYDAYQYINEEKNNLMHLGKIWVGDAIPDSRTINFKTDSPLNIGDEIHINARVLGFNANSTSVTFSINGAHPHTQAIGSNNAYSLIKYSKTINDLSGNQLSLNISPNLAGNPSGAYYFDYAEVVYPQALSFNGSQMNFRRFDLSSNSLVGFQISNASTIDEVWDLSHPTQATSLINKGNNTNFIFGYQNDLHFSNEFVAFNHSAAYLPEFVGKIPNQDLHSLTNIDYLMITVEKMIPQLQRLAQYYTDIKGMKVALATPQQIYNEFSSGSQDITAIRDFVTLLKNQGPLKYVLILGDASYDYKDRIDNNDNIVPTYQSEFSGSYAGSFATDNYYGKTQPQNFTYIYGDLADVPVGRLPASNISEAQLLIDKTLAYYNALPGQSNPFGVWRMNTAFVADDDNDGGSPFHNLIETTLDNYFGSASPIPAYHVKKLYLDAYPVETVAGGQRYPEVTDGIKAAMNKSLFLYYFGHGGINGWSQRRVLTQKDILTFENFSNTFTRFPLVSTITCEFTLWDDPQVLSAGEMMIKLEKGGATSMITSNRALSVLYGRTFTDTFIKNLFKLTPNGDFYSLGEAFLKAKIDYGANDNHLRVSFLGDPAMTLNRPQKLIAEVKIKNKETAETSNIANFQVHALDFITITGKVTTDGSTLNSNFNGKISVVIYDKPISKETLNNNGSLSPVLNYTEEGAPIVRTTGQVKNGKFTVQFYVPKDINYDLGEGRLLLYADNWTQAGDNSFDVFYNSPIKVGGVNPNGVKDDTPPVVNLFMNNIHFADGGITNQNPTFLACVTDSTGINSSGAGIGHDITAVLDGKVVDTYILNDFYTSGKGNGCSAPNLADYQKGSVTYPFNNLEPGPHQLVFKIWDINNNSTTATLNFIVKDETNQHLIIKRLLNWPNPFTNKTYIQFEHNCNSVLEVNTQIYTITGKLVRTLHNIVSAEPFREGFRTPKTAIEWDGLDDFGNAVGKGTYIFKVFVKAQNEEQCQGGATAVQKMVLLK